MPIDPTQVQWDSSPAPPDPGQVKWDATPQPVQPGSASAAAMTHNPPSHQSLGAMLYPEIDFDEGLPFLDRTHLAQADNFQEKEAYLQKVYGKGNVEVDSDPYGQKMLVVKKDGKKIAAEGGGGFGQFTADIIGSGPEWASMGAGAVEGAEIGSVGGPLGAGAGGLIGAGIGGMFGKTAIEGEKAREGIYRKTPAQYAGAVGEAGISGMEGEALGGLTTKTISKILRGPLPELITQTDPENRTLTDRTLAGGARPPAASTMPGAKKLAWTEALARKTVSGVRSQDSANSQYVADRMRDILRESGVPEPQIEPTLKELESGEAKVPTEEIGEHVKKRVQAHQEMLEGNIQAQLKDVNAQIDQQLTHLDTLTRRYQTGDLGVDVGQGIRQARRDFGTAMSKGYAKVDAMVGDRPIVPVQLIRQEAARIARRLPQSSQAGVTREMANLGGEATGQDDQALFHELGVDLPAGKDQISLGDAQRIRTMLREKSDEASLTRGVTQGEMSRLANAVDYSIQAAANDPTVGAPAVRLLNSLDKTYAQGIKRFQDATVKRLVKNLEAGLPPDPEEIARQIVQPGQEARVKEIRKLVGDSVWKRVAGADYARMMRASTTEGGGIDGARLLSEVRQRRQLMAVVYGDNLSKQIEELARTVAVRDEHLPPEALAPGRLHATLTNLRSAQEAQNRFLRENYLGLLGNPRRNPEQVYRWLVKPDNASALRQAVEMFGEDSPQITGMRQAALKELLASAKMEFADGREAGALSAALAKYTPEQQKLLFPKGMDSDLNLLGKEIEFVMRTHTDESKASFAAGAVLAMPFFTRVPIQVGIGLYQVLLSQPSVIRYLALGLRQPAGPARIAARHMVESLVRFGTLAPNLNQGEPSDGQGDTTLAGAAAGP